MWSIFGYERDTVIVFPVNLDDSVFLDGIKVCLRRIDKQAHPDIAWDSRLIYHDQASLTPAGVLGKSRANNTEVLSLSLHVKAACLWYSKHFSTVADGNIFWKNYGGVALRSWWEKKQVAEVGLFSFTSVQALCMLVWKRGSQEQKAAGQNVILDMAIKSGKTSI